MYRPNFCSECGTGITRAKWRLWTDRQFCASCQSRYRKRHVAVSLIGGLTLMASGFLVGRYQRPSAPPLIIHRSALSPLADVPLAPTTEAPAALLKQARDPDAEEVVYTCGARTRKGTPCSRRVQAPVRCWQHKGMAAMLPQEKLIIKDLAP